MTEYMRNAIKAALKDLLADEAELKAKLDVVQTAIRDARVALSPIKEGDEMVDGKDRRAIVATLGFRRDGEMIMYGRLWRRTKGDFSPHTFRMYDFDHWKKKE